VPPFSCIGSCISGRALRHHLASAVLRTIRIWIGSRRLAEQNLRGTACNDSGSSGGSLRRCDCKLNRRETLHLTVTNFDLDRIQHRLQLFCNNVTLLVLLVWQVVCLSDFYCLADAGHACTSLHMEGASKPNRDIAPRSTQLKKFMIMW